MQFHTKDSISSSIKTSISIPVKIKALPSISVKINCCTFSDAAIAHTLADPIALTSTTKMLLLSVGEDMWEKIKQLDVFTELDIH